MPAHDWTRVISGIFHDFHQRWIVEISRTLNDGVLPKGYYALAEQIAEGPRPDVLALETDESELLETGAGDSLNDAALAVAEHPPKVSYTEEYEREIYARTADRVSIHHATGDRVVAFIEIVSPGNKQSEYELTWFLKKLDEAIEQGCHLLVIDLHPPGKTNPRGIHAAYWGLHSSETHGVTPEQPLGLSAYRSDIHPNAYFEPISVDQPLPDMPLFLTPDHYVYVPLESTYTAAWNGVPQRWKTVIEGNSPQ